MAAIISFLSTWYFFIWFKCLLHLHVQVLQQVKVPCDVYLDISCTISKYMILKWIESADKKYIVEVHLTFIQGLLRCCLRQLKSIHNHDKYYKSTIKVQIIRITKIRRYIMIL